MAKYEEPISYFDMDLKGVYKLNKTAHLRLNLYVKTLEKRQQHTMVKLDHDIRETKRRLTSIENEKNKLVMKLLKTYVSKTSKKKRKLSQIPDPESVVHSRSGVNTGFTFSTYLDVPSSNKDSVVGSEFHPPLSYYRRPHSIQIRREPRLDSVHGAKAFSDFGFPTRETYRLDVRSRNSKFSENRKEIHSRFSSERDIHSRKTSFSDLSKLSSVSDLPATRGQIQGSENSEHAHNQKVKEMLGGNTCLIRGHRPSKGYNIEPLNKREKGILPFEFHPEEYIKPNQLLERIKIFGNVKIPNIQQRVSDVGHKIIHSRTHLPSQRLKPTLPPILSSMKSDLELPLQTRQLQPSAKSKPLPDIQPPTSDTKSDTYDTDDTNTANDKPLSKKSVTIAHDTTMNIPRTTNPVTIESVDSTELYTSNNLETGVGVKAQSDENNT